MNNTEAHNGYGYGFHDQGHGTSGSSNDGTVLCSLLHRRGYLTEDIWRLDAAYGQMTRDTDPDVYDGYYAWAQPIVEWIEKDTMLAKIGFHTLALPLVSSWAKHIAHRMEPEMHKDNKLGKFILTFGTPICRLIGSTINKNIGMEPKQ